MGMNVTSKEEHYKRHAKLQLVLQKANTADFFLDSTHNFERASKAYLEACSLLQHMICNTDDEGYRWMLEAIWSSYMGRLATLNSLGARKAVKDSVTEEEHELEHTIEQASFQRLRRSQVSISIAEIEEPEKVSSLESQDEEAVLKRPIHHDYEDENIEDEIHLAPIAKQDVLVQQDSRVSAYSVKSVASSVLTRASNIIQIDYIPGVTSHTISPSNPDSKGREFNMQDEPENSMVQEKPLVDSLDPSTIDIQTHETKRRSVASTMVSEVSNHRQTVDSFKTAITSRTTSTTLSFVSAVSALSFDRLGRSNSRAKIGRKFRDLLQRTNGIVLTDDFDQKQPSILKTERVPSSTPIFNEHDWCGRGMHVDFLDDVSIPLESIDFAGRGVTACVDIVRCRRVRLARKIVKLPPSRRVTKELLQEVRTLHSVSHAHVVRLVGTYIQKRNFATLLYPAAETNLEDYMQEAVQGGENIYDFGKLSSAREVLAKGALCLASGLRFLHKNDIIHSDIKPANIVLKKGPLFFDESYKMYFCDFGISRILDPEEESQTEEVRGKTPMYAAPEVMKWEAHGRAADIYSLGYVLAEMATVCSGKTFKEFRNFIQDVPFKAYYKQYHVEKISGFLLKCYPMGVPNHFIAMMVDEDPNNRPRLGPTKLPCDGMIFEMDCEHNDDGPAPFEIG